MIVVNENYVIDVDRYCYTVKRDLHKVDKNGEPRYDIVGYYGTPESAIKGVLSSMNKTRLSEGKHTLEEALNIIQSNQQQFNELLEKVVSVNE